VESHRGTRRRTVGHSKSEAACGVIQKPITISGLTPTTIYGFQVQALGVLGYAADKEENS